MDKVAAKLMLLRLRRRWQRTLRRLGHKLEQTRKWFWRHKNTYDGIAALVVIGPPWVVNNYFTSDTFAKDLRLYIPAIDKLLGQGAVLWMSIAILWTFVIRKLHAYAVSKMQQEPEGWADIPLSVLTVLNEVVGHKEQRFSNYLKSTWDLLSAGNKPAPGEVFNKITQPLAQFHRLTEGVYKVFDLLCRNGSDPNKPLKVNLALLEDGQLTSIICHLPTNIQVRSPLTELNNDGSGIKTAYKREKIVVIESIRDAGEEPGAGFHVTSDKWAAEDGALICYPVTLPAGKQNTAFVISVFYPCRGGFLKRYEETYVAILEPFALRLKMEFSLLTLKEVARG